jgi:hypothetical protein
MPNVASRRPQSKTPNLEPGTVKPEPEPRTRTWNQEQ